MVFPHFSCLYPFFQFSASLELYLTVVNSKLSLFLYAQIRSSKTQLTVIDIFKMLSTSTKTYMAEADLHNSVELYLTELVTTK